MDVVQVVRPKCKHCWENHESADCNVASAFAQLVEKVNYMQNLYRQQNNPYSNSYNPDWKNHPNFSLVIFR